MPSSSALCASMGPSMASPMAYTEGTLVWKCSFTSMRFSRSNCTPSSSRPMPRVNGRRPMATRTTSNSSSSALPFLLSTCSFTTSPTTCAPFTLVPILNFIFCFFRMDWNFLLTSPSEEGTILSRNSMQVTSEPSRFQTDPISRPITPPPITASRLGTSAMSSAPVESTMRPPALSTGQVGSGVTSEPLAIMMLVASTPCEPPSTRSTLMELGPVSLPKPFT
mmetsp:Transcript_4235/g.5962  ORF Transcript_4235/g.5962 Transcript_4235/m.5962 type:complete len:222 (-) Transcript_4235:529-1194(-)